MRGTHVITVPPSASMRRVGACLGIALLHFTVLLIVSPPGLIQAQARNTQVSRAPMLMDSTSEARLRLLVQMRIAELERGFQIPDSMSRRPLSANSVFAPSDALAGQRMGCPSFEWMLARLRQNRQARGSLASVGPQLQLRGVVTGGDTARAQIRLSVNRRTVDAALEFLRDGDALELVRAPGLYSALCRMAIGDSLPVASR